jgi:hypothetical protein
VTVTSWPAIVKLPDRGGPGFDDTETATCTGPDPDRVPIVIQSASVDAVQGHPAPVVIDDDTEPAAGPMSCAVGDTEYVQPLAWATLTVRPAIAIDVLRAGPVFAATEN